MTPRHSIDPAMVALLKANMRAAMIRFEAGGQKEWDHMPIMRGAPTHSCAFFLQALEEEGWTLAKVYPAEQLPPYEES